VPEPIDNDLAEVRNKIKEILQLADDLSEFDYHNLSESEKITFNIAKIVRQDFLQQNSFAIFDGFCPGYKTVWMMKNIVLYYNLAQGLLIEEGFDSIITWEQIKELTQLELTELVGMKFISHGEEIIVERMRQLHEDIHNRLSRS